MEKLELENWYKIVVPLFGAAFAAPNKACLTQNTVRHTVPIRLYSVIHGLTGTSIELQPCLGMSWYDLNLNVARVCTNKARIYLIKQGLSWFELDLQNDCCTVPSTV